VEQTVSGFVSAVWVGKALGYLPQPLPAGRPAPQAPEW